MPKRTIYFDGLPLAHDKLSGIGHALLEIINTLDNQNDYKIVLVMPLGKVDKLKKYKFKHIKTRTIPLPAKILELLLRLNIMIPIDILIGRGAYIFINYKNWPLIRSKSITFIHDVGFLRHPEYVEPKNQKYLSKYIHRWVKRSDKIIAISEFTKKEIIELLEVAKSKIEVLYLGVDTSTYYPRGENEINLIREKYELGEKQYFLYVGNIEPRKNLENLIDAYVIYCQKFGFDTSLVLVGGDGWLNDRIYAAIEKAQNFGCDIIKPSKYVIDADLPALYSGAIALVHPTLYEGFGIPPLQAMACGVTVIVPRNSSIPEVVGESGVYIQHNNPQGIYEKMKLVTTLGFEKSQYSGVKRASEFSWRNTVDGLLRTLKSLGE